MHTRSLLACAVACMALPAAAAEPLPAGFHYAIVNGWAQPAVDTLDPAKPLLRVEAPVTASTPKHSPLSEPLPDSI